MVDPTPLKPEEIIYGGSAGGGKTAKMEESALTKSMRTKKPVLAAHITRGKPAKIRA